MQQDQNRSVMNNTPRIHKSIKHRNIHNMFGMNGVEPYVYALVKTLMTGDVKLDPINQYEFCYRAIT